MDLNAEIEKGLQHLHAGQLQKAEAIYEKLLSTNSNHSDLLHLLGVISHQRSDSDKAAQLIHQAIRIQPTNPFYYCSLADLLIDKGMLDDAIACYRKALALKPDFDMAHYNLGNTFAARGNAREAISCYQCALAANPNLAEAHYNLAHVFHDLAKYDKALTHYRNALRLKPDHVDTCFHLANLLLAQGNSPEAVPHYQKVLELNPTHVDAHNNLGRAFNECGKFDRAIDCFQTAVYLDPEFAEGYFNLGLAFKNRGNIEEALAGYQKALKLNPQLAIAHHALGELLHDQGNYDEAICQYEKTLRIQPNFPETYYNLGNIAKDQGRLAESMGNFQKAIEVKPNFAEAYNNLGLVYKDQDRLNEAVDCYQKALQLKPDLVEACYNLGIVHQIQGKYQAGLAFYEQALQINPDYAPAKWLYYLSLPIFYDTQTDISAHRKRFADNLDKLIKETTLGTTAHKIMALRGVASTTNFYLQYQGLDDLSLQKTYGKFVCRVMAANYPQWSKPLNTPKSPSPKKIRLGYVSSFMRNHTVGVYLMGWLANHDRSEFEISCYHIGNQTDALTKIFQQRSDHFYQIGGNIEAAAGQIISDDLDILVFTDIGMNAPATQLAGLRLAPVQCKGWGHPVTTGLPTIDYYLSSDLMEPENAHSHYSEELIRLPNLALSYKKPNLPAHPKSRGEFGIGEDAFVYLISQSLFKLLPQYDSIYPRIALEVPNARFAFISHKNTEITAKFKHRLAKAFQAFELDPNDFCIFLPRLNHPDFLSLNLSSDVLLDTFSWSGGNTTLEGISCNLPVVTCPGEFMRGRHAYAMLKMMGINETIAKNEKDYIDIAAQLGQEKNFHHRVRQLMEENQSRLFEDTSCIRALEKFYRQTASSNRPNCVVTDGGRPDQHQESKGIHYLNAEIYYEKGKRLQNENCENEAIEYFQKSLACIPNYLGIKIDYSRYLFEGQSPRAYKNDFVSEIYQALARCLYHQKRIEDAWFAIRAALVCNPANKNADELAGCIIADLQKSQERPTATTRHASSLSKVKRSELADTLTILMVTNCTGKLKKFAHLSPPQTGLVETTYASTLHVLGKELEKCQKFLVYDRQTPDDENENVYQDNLIQFAENRGFDLKIVVGFGLQKIVRDIIEKVKSPYLLFLEHDWEFQGPKINIEGLINVFEQNQFVNYVRFNKRKNVISHFDFTLEKETSITDIDLIRTVAHSNNPHIVRVEKFRKEWLPICLGDPMCQKMDLSGKAFGIENPLFKQHMQDVRKMGFAHAQEIWGTYIFGQLGDPPRIRHLGE